MREGRSRRARRGVVAGGSQGPRGYQWATVPSALRATTTGRGVTRPRESRVPSSRWLVIIAAETRLAIAQVVVVFSEQARARKGYAVGKGSLAGLGVELQVAENAAGADC